MGFQLSYMFPTCPSELNMVLRLQVVQLGGYAYVSYVMLRKFSLIDISVIISGWLASVKHGREVTAASAGGSGITLIACALSHVNGIGDTVHLEHANEPVSHQQYLNQELGMLGDI